MGECLDEFYKIKINEKNKNRYILHFLNVLKVWTQAGFPGSIKRVF